mgnify:CR=1 FL=1
MPDISHKTIHQLVHTLSYGDAISGEALALKKIFRSRGVQSEIYAINIDPKLKVEGKFFSELNPAFSGAAVLHYSLGSPLNEVYKNLDNAEKFLIYHNLTPHQWFSGVNPGIVKDIKQGMQELPELCSVSDRLVSDSKFNAQELAKLGFDSAVLELPLDPERWQVTANQGIEGLLKSNPKLNIVHVGRLAPNKCIEDIIKSFYFLHHKIDKNSHLWLVGIDIDTEVYSFALKRLVYELSLSDAVSFVGRFVDSELKALYCNSSLYLCMSEHEGFCMPVIEAMHFGLPVIAYASSALPDTVAAGGVLVDDKSPHKIAELAYRVCSDSALRNQLIQAGKKRAAELSYDNFTRQVCELFAAKEKIQNHALGA